MLWNLSYNRSTVQVIEVSLSLYLSLSLPFPISPPLSLLSSFLFLDLEDEEEMMCFADPSRFITDPNFCYQEFARKEEDHFQVFRVQVRTANSS